MNKNDIINIFIRNFFLSYFTYLVYLKIINLKNTSFRKEIIIILGDICLSIIYILLVQFIKPFYAILLIFFTYAIILSYILNNEINYSIVITMISFAITYITYLISLIFVAMILGMIFDKMNLSPEFNYKNIIILGTVVSFNIILINLLFKIKRLNKGINFLKEIKINKKITVYSILFTSIIILIFELLQNENGILLNLLLSIGSILISISLILWIKSQITKSYRSKMRDRTIEIQKTEIDEKEKIIEDIKEENIKLANTIHKYNHKFSSLEHAMKSAIVLDSKTEFANELSVILKETNEALKNFSKEVETTKRNKLPLTEIPGIDNIFKYMNEEATKNNINFDLRINENIGPLINNLISKDKFETLISDHIKDAIIAVNSSTNTYKSILAVLGLVDGSYEFSVYDTGIEFEIETLLKLGKERVTTHKETGGSGIGFMTTFETLKECKASLIIEEYNPKTTNYTKSVSIKFDGKNEYKICSYRAENIKKQNKDKRIIIENL